MNWTQRIKTANAEASSIPLAFIECSQILGDCSHFCFVLIFSMIVPILGMSINCGHSCLLDNAYCQP